MKNALLYIIFFTYSASIVKPAMPYIADVIAHTFYYAEHVKTVHVENGKFHVHYELIKHNGKSNTGDAEDAMKKISFSSEHLVIELPFLFSPFFTLYKYPGSLTLAVFFTDHSTDSPPPRC